MSPSLQTMGFFMSDINFCNTKEQLTHLGEVVTGKVDGSPTGADIDESTLPYTGQVRRTLPALEGEYEQSITDKEAEADAAIDSYRLLNKGPYAPGVTLESKFEFITYNGESYFALNPPYTTTATTPDVDGNLFVGGYLTSGSNQDFGTVSSGIQVKHRRGTNSEILAGTPSAGEIWFNTTDNTIHIGDGSTIGGIKQVGGVSVRNFGASASGDSTSAINNAFLSGLPLVFEDVEYTVSGKLTKSNSAHVNWGNAVISGSGITDTSIDSVLSIEGDDTLTALPSMSSNLSFSDRNVTFTASHGLAVGDWFVVYDPRDYSYSPARVGYKAGEFMQVKQVVSTTEVVISGTVFSKTGYESAECEVYKVSKSRFSFSGNLTVKTPSIGSSIRAISISNALDTDISGFKGIAEEGVIGIVLSQCINITGDNVVGQQSGDISVDYGVAVVSSQHVRLNGHFTGRRHGFTTAEQNYGDVGVVNRDMHIDGYFSSYDPDLASADTHGNTEYLTFTGTIDGGLNLRGNHLSCHARIFADESGRCIQFTELVGYDFDISGSYLYGSNLDSLWGIISSGYTGTTATPDYPETIGGLLNMRDVTIDAPNASLLVSILKKASLATNVKVDLRGLNIVNSQNFPRITLTDSTASGKFEYLNLSGVDGLGTDINLTHTRLSKVIAKVSGSVTVTTDGDSRAQETTDFGISFGFEYTPTVFTSLGTSGNVPTAGGSTFIIPYGVPTGSANSQAFIGYGSSDNSNMTSGSGRAVNWSAE